MNSLDIAGTDNMHDVSKDVRVNVSIIECYVFL